MKKQPNSGSTGALFEQMMRAGKLPVAEIVGNGMRSINPPISDKIMAPSQIQLDLVMAYRCLYYCDSVSMIPDPAFDELDKEARSAAPRDHPIHKPGSDRRDDYTPAVRALALYLRLAYSKRSPSAVDSLEPEEEVFDSV